MRLLLDLSHVDITPNGTSVDSLHLSSSIAQQCPPSWHVQPVGTAALESMAKERVPDLCRAAWKTKFSPAIDPTVIFVSRQVHGSHVAFLKSRYPSARVIVRWLDFISVRNFSYAPNAASWLRTVAGAAAALEMADGVAFLSDVVKGQAETFTLPTDTWVTVPVGLDHLAEGAPDSAAAAPLLLMVGSDYPHKRRDVAIETLAKLVARGVDAQLDFCGRAIHRVGTSTDDRMLALRLGVADRIRLNGELTADELALAYRRSSVTLYPSTEEGFGIVPFEAARAGCAALASAVGPLPTMLPAECIVESHDPAQWAESVIAALQPERRAHNVASARAAATRFRWADAGAAATTLIERVARTPRREPLWRLPIIAGRRAHQAAAIVHGSYGRPRQ